MVALACPGCTDTQPKKTRKAKGEQFGPTAAYKRPDNENYSRTQEVQKVGTISVYAQVCYGLEGTSKPCAEKAGDG